jgi:hypothetical protein
MENSLKNKYLMEVRPHHSWERWGWVAGSAVQRLAL